jgi:hypothetical protein
MNIVEYFQARKSEIDAQLQAIESGRVIRLICETKGGPDRRHRAGKAKAPSNKP